MFFVMFDVLEILFLYAMKGHIYVGRIRRIYLDEEKENF